MLLHGIEIQRISLGTELARRKLIFHLEYCLALVDEVRYQAVLAILALRVLEALFIQGIIEVWCQGIYLAIIIFQSR